MCKTHINCAHLRFLLYLTSLQNSLFQKGAKWSLLPDRFLHRKVKIMVSTIGPDMESKYPRTATFVLDVNIKAGLSFLLTRKI